MLPINLAVDLTEAYRRLIHVEIDHPVQPCVTARFTTPLWLCESHCPNGPVSTIAGLFFSAKGSHLSWRRDPKAPFIYLVDIPKGVSSVHVSFDAVLRKFSTRRMVMLLWEIVLLHPAHTPVSQVHVKASVTIPGSWDYSSALQAERTDSTANSSTKTISFIPVTVERLKDSPVLVGQHMDEVFITPDKRHMLCVAASEAQHSRVPQLTMMKLNRLVHETHAVFGNPPYEKYRFLIMASNLLVPPELGIPGGAEHADSTHIFVYDEFLANQDKLDWYGDILSHEFSHAWNGKHRRPAGHVTDDLTTPLDGSLLWVYEGLTHYYGQVLAVRCGMMSPSTFRVKLATIAAEMDNQPGRLWRSIEDTGTGLSLGKGLGLLRTVNWENWLRSADYYSEGVLLWLDVDTLIRQRTGDRKTLDDFCSEFYGGDKDTDLKPVPYTLQQLQSTLHGVLPYDWATFFKERVTDVSPQLNTHGIERAGYKFVFSDKSFHSRGDTIAKLEIIWNSLGLRVNPDGHIQDVRRFGPADAMKLAPTQTITHINAAKFSIDELMEQIQVVKETRNPFLVTLKQDEDVWVAEISYYGGLRYPRLLRQADERDMLAAIISPRCDA